MVAIIMPTWTGAVFDQRHGKLEIKAAVWSVLPTQTIKVVISGLAEVSLALWLWLVSGIASNRTWHTP